MKTIYLPRLYEIANRSCESNTIYTKLGINISLNRYQIDIDNNIQEWLIICYGIYNEKNIRVKLQHDDKKCCYYINCREKSKIDKFFNDNSIQHDIINFYQENNYLKTIIINLSPKIIKLKNILFNLFKNKQYLEYKKIIIQKISTVKAIFEKDEYPQLYYTSCNDYTFNITINKIISIKLSINNNKAYLSKIFDNEDKLFKLLKRIIFISAIK